MIITVLDYSSEEVHQIKINIDLSPSEISNIISLNGHRLKDICYMVHDTEEIKETILTLDKEKNYNYES